MKHLQSEKYNIAWFKLAECVSRGEKERAMGVYRLLSHSLGNQALVAQLKGDLLLCFNDDGAITKYCEAADMYKESNKIIEAIAVYEHLIVLDSNNEKYLFELLDLYKNIDIPCNMVDHVKNLVDEGKLDVSIKLADKLSEYIKLAQEIDLREHIVFALLKQNKIPENTVMDHLKKLVELLISVNDESVLQRFLSELKSIHLDYYDEICSYIEKE